jgi:hypothetical protein
MGPQMKARKSHKVTDHSGSTFDSFLEQEGIREEVEAVAIRRVREWTSAQVSCLSALQKTEHPGRNHSQAAAPACRLPDRPQNLGPTWVQVLPN